MRLGAEQRAEFLRAIAQALVNVRRHAGVTEAEVALGSHENDVSAMVVDAGVGFEMSPAGSGRLGVGMSIVARLEAIGGEAQVWSRPGSGTTVMLRVPLIAASDTATDARPESATDVIA